MTAAVWTGAGARAGTRWSLLPGNFAIGCGTVLVPDALNDLARGLGVTVSMAGQHITAAWAMAVSAPLPHGPSFALRPARRGHHGDACRARRGRRGERRVARRLRLRRPGASGGGRPAFVDRAFRVARAAPDWWDACPLRGR